MDENVGKIYCLDRGNDDALAAAILANGKRKRGSIALKTDSISLRRKWTA